MTSGIGSRSKDLWNYPVYLFGHADEEENLKKLQAGVDNTVQALLHIKKVTTFVNDLIEKNYIRFRTDIQPSRVAKTSLAYKNAFNEIAYVASTVEGHPYLTAIQKAMRENLMAYFISMASGGDDDGPSVNTSAAQTSLAIAAKTLTPEAQKILHELLQPFDESLNGSIKYLEAIPWIRELHTEGMFAFREEIPVTLDEAYKRLADIIARKGEEYFTLRNAIEFGTLDPFELMQKIDDFDWTVQNLSPEDLATINALLPPFEETLHLKLIDSFRELDTEGWLGLNPSVSTQMSPEEVFVKLANVWWSSEGREYFNIRFLIAQQKKHTNDIALLHRLKNAFEALSLRDQETIGFLLLEFDIDG